MKKITKLKKYQDLLLPIYIVINLLYIFIGSYFYTIHSLKYSTYSKGYITLVIINVIVLAILFLYRIKKDKKLNFNISDLFLVFMMIFSFISYIFAKKPEVALYGMPGRYEGLYQIFYYYSIYMLTTYINPKYKKTLTISLLIPILIECVYAFFQVINVGDVVRSYNLGKVWANGLTTNPNFFGSLSLLGLSSSIGLFIDSKQKSKSIICLSLIIVFMIGLLISNTMSVVVGLICVLLYLLIYIIVKKKYLKYLVLIFTLTLTLIYVTSINKTTLINDFIKTSNETKEIVKGNIEDEYGTKRMFIWRKTLEIVPKNLLHGVGIDNFYYAFGSKPIGKGRWFFDKAHNEYLQILITEGIFSLLSYLAFYSALVIRGIKENYKEEKVYLLLPVLGYLVQAFFNISVIEVAPFFYIYLGLCVTRESGGKHEKSKRRNTST